MRPRLTLLQRVSIWTVNRLPPILVRETERVILSVAVALVGVTSLMAASEPGTLRLVLPFWLLIEWAVTLLLGGVLTLAGMFSGGRLVERVGIALSAVGSSTYAATLLAVGSARGRVIAIVFIAIALCCLIRMASSTAANALTERNNGGHR